MNYKKSKGDKLKEYKQAPLPFQGQKRFLLASFKEALREFGDKKVFIDLFGGSGLLSNAVKRMYPEAKVVYNDFDGYSERINNIPQTNEILDELRALKIGGQADKIISGRDRERIEEVLGKWDKKGYVDWLSISASLLFSMKYCKDLESMKKEGFYNKVRQRNYEKAEDYLEGLEIVSKDFREVFEEYKDVKGVVFIVDPPYLNTDVSSYKDKNYWKLGDHLDILYMLEGRDFFYFTSEKSNIVELDQWIENKFGKGIFERAKIAYTRNGTHMGKTYKDIMYWKKACK